jgi:hypothetical protein
MPRSARLLAVASGAALTLLTGCTSHATTCAGSSCTVNLTGAQIIEIDPGVGIERDLRVGPIEPVAVTVSVYGDQAAAAGRRRRGGRPAGRAGVRVR